MRLPTPLILDQICSAYSRPVTFRLRTPRGYHKKIRAVHGKPTARVLDPEIADLLPRAGTAAHSKDFWHDRSGTLRLMFD
jgi:hypothetical protein